MPTISPGLLAGGIFWRALLTIAMVGTLSSNIFLVLVLVAALRFHRIARSAAANAAAIPDSSLPAVTMLKPVHGMEPRLAENIESFFRQDYPDFEIVFGARSADNPALRVVEA